MTDTIEQDWHSLDTDEVIRRLKTNASYGLSSAEAGKRLAEFGSNTLPEPKLRSIFYIFLQQFLSPLIYLLLVAAAVAIFIGNNRDAVVILVVVVFNSIIGATQEGRAEQSLGALRRLSRLRARVLRDKKEFLIEASEVVPGDIIALNAGDSIPADSRLINSQMLTTSEASLTGESVPVNKSVAAIKKHLLIGDRENIVYAGTYVTAGHGHAVVIATGIKNEIGKIAMLTSAMTPPKTQLEIRIQQFGRYVFFTALCIFASVIAIGLKQKIPFEQIFMIAISQMVSLVPEGLPVAMTVILAIGVQRMANRKTIVRKLSAVETLGSTTVICSDKTGTLTRNEMMVTEAYLSSDKRLINVSGSGYTPTGNFENKGRILSPATDKNLHKLFEACVLCNDSQLLDPDQPDAQWKILGDPTEAALLSFAVKGGADLFSLRKLFPRQAEIPFSPDDKLMATQHKTQEGNIVFIKGAPEAVLDLADSSLTDITEIKAIAKKMSEDSLRVLALGYIPSGQINLSKGFVQFKNKIILLGLVGELDLPREEVAESIRNCRRAGIRPVMITGDHKNTGLAIAKTLGISQKNNLAIDGYELDQLSDEELTKKLDHISVFARVQPAQKLRIVEAYQKKGEVVAMTGDGVNDAPALMRANVGIAMGISGTEVAKEAAKIIITDDNFSTIVSAVSEGRLVHQNIKKLILFLMVTSIDEVIILLLALIFGFSPPFAAIQILWLNLVAEGTLTVNLIMEPPEGNEMNRPPVAVNEPLLDRNLLSRFPLMILTSVASTFLWFIYRTSQQVSPVLVQTETFTILVLCQWFNVLNCRSATRSSFKWDILKNPWLVGGLLLSMALHLCVIYWPPLNNFFQTTPIKLDKLLIITAIASLVLWTEEIRKIFARRKLNE